MALPPWHHGVGASRAPDGTFLLFTMGATAEPSTIVPCPGGVPSWPSSQNCTRPKCTGFDVRGPCSPFRVSVLRTLNATGHRVTLSLRREHYVFWKSSQFATAGGKQGLKSAQNTIFAGHSAPSPYGPWAPIQNIAPASPSNRYAGTDILWNAVNPDPSPWVTGAPNTWGIRRAIAQCGSPTATVLLAVVKIGFFEHQIYLPYNLIFFCFSVFHES